MIAAHFLKLDVILSIQAIKKGNVRKARPVSGFSIFNWISNPW
jgi:hypothetical protein